jgi:hypothetical protein
MSQHSEDLAAERDLIYDWNAQEKVGSLSPKRKVTFLDETCATASSRRRWSIRPSTTSCG